MKKILAIVAVAFPSLALAQSLVAMENINNVSDRALTIGDAVIYFLVAIAVIYIIYNVVVYMIAPAASEKRGDAGKAVLWGILGLFIIVSIWGLVNILVNTFSTRPTTKAVPNLSAIPGAGGIPAAQKPIVQ